MFLICNKISIGKRDGIAVQRLVPSIANGAIFGGGDGHKEQKLPIGRFRLAPVREADHVMVFGVSLIDGRDGAPLEAKRLLVDFADEQMSPWIAVDARII